MYPIGFWVLIIVLLNAVIGLSFISSERTTVYAAALATFVLLSIGAKTGAGVYGPDSYIKAMKVRQILRVGRVEIDLYNGLEVLAAITQLLAPEVLLQYSIYAGISVLTPFAAAVFSRRFGLHNLERRLLISGSIFLPFGMGMWLSTRSLFHPYYLSLPLAVIFIVYLLRFVARPTWPMCFISLGAGLGLLIIHPMAALLSILFAFIIGLSDTLLSQELRTTQVLGRLRQFNIHFTLIATPFIIYFIYFQLLDALSTVFLVLLGFGSAESVTTICVPSDASPIDICGLELALGNKFHALILFAAATGCLGTTVLDRLRTSLVDGFYDHTAGRSTGLYLALLFSFVIVALGVIRRGLAYRLLGLGAFLGLAIVAIIASRTYQRPRRSTMMLFAGGCLTVLALPIVIGIGDLRILAITISVSTIAFVGGSVVSYRRNGATLLLCSILIIFAVSVPILYPFAALNAEPNQAGTDVDHNMVAWTTEYDVEQVATGTTAWRVYRYQNPVPDNDFGPYRGSAWLEGELVLDDDEQQVQSIQDVSGQPTNESTMTHVMISPLSSEYVPVSYTNDSGGDETVYKQTRSLSAGEVQQRFPGGARVYHAGDNAVIVYVD
ncbi:hypothetical protein ACFQGT_17985 [Natrialbaceae archaeon GCM10025810]|uniref:hypothetical protein n=1 Tax=Halovalidus salilacus TaxID=3075124 RepID=UPI00360B8055